MNLSLGWLGHGLVRRGARDSLNIRFETALSARLKPKEAEDIVSFFKQLLIKYMVMCANMQLQDNGVPITCKSRKNSIKRS